jgi:hypothetical protein
MGSGLKKTARPNFGRKRETRQALHKPPRELRPRARVPYIRTGRLTHATMTKAIHAGEWRCVLTHLTPVGK